MTAVRGLRVVGTPPEGLLELCVVMRSKEHLDFIQYKRIHLCYDLVKQ